MSVLGKLEIEQNWMQRWLYGKGLIHLTANISWKLAYLRASSCIAPALRKANFVS